MAIWSTLNARIFSQQTDFEVKNDSGLGQTKAKLIFLHQGVCLLHHNHTVPAVVVDRTLWCFWTQQVEACKHGNCRLALSSDRQVDVRLVYGKVYRSVIVFSSRSQVCVFTFRSMSSSFFLF